MQVQYIYDDEPTFMYCVRVPECVPLPIDIKSNAIVLNDIWHTYQYVYSYKYTAYIYGTRKCI